MFKKKIINPFVNYRCKEFSIRDFKDKFVVRDSTWRTRLSISSTRDKWTGKSCLNMLGYRICLKRK